MTRSRRFLRKTRAVQNLKYPKLNPPRTDPLQSLNVKLALFNVRSLTNKTFILNDFITCFILDFFIFDRNLVEGW